MGFCFYVVICLQFCIFKGFFSTDVAEESQQRMVG